jgi:hypothetical protein
MLAVNHTENALECVLFQNEIEALVKALHNYGELCHEEIKAAGDVEVVESLETALELAAHAVALADAADIRKVRQARLDVRKRLGFYSIPKEEACA